MPGHRHPRARRGFSMIESLMGVTITTIAGAALLTSLSAAVRSSSDALHTAVARGLAEQLMDEIASARFPNATNTAPSGSTRADFDDVDDYAGWSESPPADRSGRELGTEGYQLLGVDFPRLFQMRPESSFLGAFRRSVEVERVQPDAGSGWTATTQHTRFRRVTVAVSRRNGRGRDVPLARATRIFSHVPYAP